ncbi:A 70 kDa DNA-binding subunit-like [Octopus vulgaris]|uniref:Replication protein A subunit n=1 Tax=Octopus vulgaris TaxID=6645 RepID=A0AA36FK32_OCTVU|nr:A 70 kDa DNA-binding subunit-like [Octopus vulgaris]
MSYQLTSGALQTIINGENIEKPILQILSSKKIPSSAGAERYRLLLSDGQLSYSSVMLATQLNPMMEDGSLDNLSVIKLNKFLCNIIQNDKKVIILLDLEVIAKASEVGQKIGNPKSYRAGEAAPAAENNTNSLPAPSKPPSVPIPNRTPLGSGPVVNNKPPGLPTTPGGTGRIHAIAGLSLYQNRWKICARVTHKSAVRNWSNSRGEGKLFSVTFLDDSGEIRATGFNDAVDKFFEFLQVNKAYYVSRATLKMANKKFSSVQNDFEMTFNSDTVIELCTENTNLPTITYDFKPLKDLGQIEPNTIIDVIGVVTNVGDITTVVGRQSNKEFSKRDLQLADQSGMSVRFTIWGGDAESFQDNKNPVVAVKGAKVSDWGGRTLSLLSSGQMILNPDIREAHFLRGWYDRDGCNMEFNTFQGDSASIRGGNEWKTFEQVKSEKLGATKPDYFTSKGTVIFIKKGNCMYMACPNENCNKKLVDQGNNQYRCEKCDQEFPNFKWRLLLLTNIADYTGSQWVTCFQDSAESLLGVSADELGSLKEMDEFAFDQVFQEASFKSYIFNLRAKFETYNDETRLKTICVSATPVDWKTYGQRLIKEINNTETRA